VVPGKTMSFATAQPRRRGAIPLLATTFDGRPIKMEGNPLHPVSQGNSDNHSQASILDLYDPARRRHLTLKGKKAAPEQLDTEVQRIRAESAASGGTTLGILADESVSPSRERLRAEILRQFPQATWAVYEPLSPGYDNEASTAAFGPGTQFRADLAKASAILAVDCEISPIPEILQPVAASGNPATKSAASMWPSPVLASPAPWRITASGSAPAKSARFSWSWVDKSAEFAPPLN
jgi:molybdopterin-containing oxidoreductase family iron-sulfur binding subunit